MSRRKLIGLLLPNPEAVYQQRLMDGVFMQCRKYGYECAVFSPLVQVCHYYKDYLSGELNIFELINFDRLDGVILPAISLSEDNNKEVPAALLERLKRECTKPVVSIDLPFGDYPVIETDDRSAFSVITEHILDIHKCSPDKIYFLTGMEHYDVSKKRLGGFTDVYEKRGFEIKKENIFYGDFWYSGGEDLAEKISSGEVEMPEAVICASDHMAIGLANKLIEKGIDVPGKVIVTGYDATAEAAINEPAITTYVPDVVAAAAKTVETIHNIIEPGTADTTTQSFSGTGLRICASCGCAENMSYVKECLNSSLYNVNHNFVGGKMPDEIDIGMLLESYMFENLTSADGVEDCLKKIAASEYLIRPYGKLYLCLEENWLDTTHDKVRGYGDRMRTVVLTEDSKNGGEAIKYSGNSSLYSFDTGVMLPELDEERSEPAVFYFSPIHFKEEPLGYAVLQCPLSQKHKINIVFRNWIRNVNNAVEMMRIQEELRKFSERDAMTGLYNRRGMETHLNQMRNEAKPGDNIIVFVVDMDGLKHINDTYGHNEGDYGISAIAAAVRSVTRNREICVRAGGDEFYIIGIGEYSAIDAIVRSERLSLAITEVNKSAAKPYEISASIGYSLRLFFPEAGIDAVLNEADEKMYKNKIARKKQRIN